MKALTCGERCEEIVTAERPCDANGEQRECQILSNVGLAVYESMSLGDLQQAGEQRS